MKLVGTIEIPCRDQEWMRSLVDSGDYGTISEWLLDNDGFDLEIVE